MNTARILSFILLPLLTFAQAPAPYPVLVDSQRATVPALEVFQANAVTFRASFKSGNIANAIVTESPFMYWQPYGATNATVVTANWSIVSAPSGVVDFAFAPADLNFAAGTYSYQVGLEQSGGPQVIKQGSFTIRPSQASIGAEPIAFATTNVNWGLINWTGVPDFEYQTNTIAQVATLNASIATASNALNNKINSVSNALADRISIAESNIIATSNAMVNVTGDTMSGDLGFTNAGLTSLDFVQFDLAPAGAIVQGRMQWEPSRDTLRMGLDENVNLDVGQQLVLYAKSIETNTINKGEVVLVVGAVADNPAIKRASNASEALSSRTIGIAAENIASNNNGFVVTAGTIYNVNTVGFAQGAQLYLGANGTLQTNLPDAPLHGVFIGTVERVGANNGQIFVQVQNYQELEELSDVKVSSVQNRDLIAYNTVSNRWQNYSISALGLATGTPLYAFTEVDPLFVAASNSFNTRITAVETGKVDLTVYTPATQALWTAIGNIVSADNALTNVTASGRITAVKTGAQVALTFDASGLATGTPIYNVDGKLDSNTWAAADSTTNYASRITFNATSNSFNSRVTAVEGYTNTAASALASSVWASADSTTNYQTRTGFISASNAINTRLVSVEGYTSRVVAVEGYTNRAALALASNTWASADSTTNYQTRTGFISASNAINGRLVAVEAYTSRVVTAESNITALQGYTNRAAAALASNVWASADSTTNYALRTTFVTATNALDNKFTNFLQLAGGTVVGDLRVQRSTTASTTLTLTNNGSVSTGLRIDLPASSTFLDLNGTNDKYTFTDTTANFHGNTITNAVVAGYLTVTGAAATYVNSTNLPAGIVTTNNLSTIAGSGLGVESNRLVVTNIPTTFEALTGNNFIMGLNNGNVTISTNSLGSFFVGNLIVGGVTGAASIAELSHGAAQFLDNRGKANIARSSYGSQQKGRIIATNALVIITNSSGAVQSGQFGVVADSPIYTNEIRTSAGAKQQGLFFVSPTASGNFEIINSAGAVQNGAFSDSFLTIGPGASGAHQIGMLIEGSSATNLARGAIQIMGGLANETYLTTTNGRGSILLGPGTQTNAYGILANGPIQSLSGFVGNAASLTNFPSSILTVTAGNENYWRITTAPTGATSSGSSGQMAVSGTNLFIYSPNALGVGTARWLRVNAEANW